MKIEWRSLDDLTAVCRANVERVRKLKPEVIVGIPRSGMLPASQLALALGLPLADLHSFCAERMWARGGNADDGGCNRRVLLVDDASGFGKTMKAALAVLTARRPECSMATCTVYATPSAFHKFDIAFEQCPKPRLFEWNWWRNGWLDKCCVDIDGVLCTDPTKAQRRDPEQYRRFLAEAAPLFLTAKPVHALVTGRSSSYRAETEDWMFRHGVQYGALQMLDGAPPRSAEGHAERKAAFYRTSPAGLFIESCARQAELIAKLSGKDALCITTRRLYPGTPC